MAGGLVVVRYIIPKQNTTFKQWSEETEGLQVINLAYSYSNTSYNKLDRTAGEQEVLVINF